MVFIRDRCAEDRHDAVAGELVDGPSVPLHHSSGVIDKFGHDLAEAFRTHGRRDLHGVHDVGEQHRDLLVFRRSDRVCGRRTALTTELGRRTQLRAARLARQARGRQCAAVVPAIIHASIVSPLVRHVCYIATRTLPDPFPQTDEPPSPAFCTPADTRLGQAILYNCHRSERRTRVRVSGFLPTDRA